MVLFKDNLQGFNRRTYYQTSRQKKREKKKNFIENTPVLIGWEKNSQKYSQNIKLNETGKNVEC